MISNIYHESVSNVGVFYINTMIILNILIVFRYLIDHGARLDAVNNDGDLPIDVADGKKLKFFLSDLMDKRGE